MVHKANESSRIPLLYSRLLRYRTTRELRHQHFVERNSRIKILSVQYCCTESITVPFTRTRHGATLVRITDRLLLISASTGEALTYAVFHKLIAPLHFGCTDTVIVLVAPEASVPR